MLDAFPSEPDPEGELVDAIIGVDSVAGAGAGVVVELDDEFLGGT